MPTIILLTLKSYELRAIMYGHTYSKGVDQPGKVANPARGQLDRENISLSAFFAPENLNSRDGFGSPVPRQPAHLHTVSQILTDVLYYSIILYC